MSNKNTQLTSPIGYNTDRMIFSKVQVNNIPNSPLTFKRINISTRNEDGTIGELILGTELLFSFGLSANTEVGTGALTGYSLPLSLVSKDNPTEEEKAFVTTINNICARCKEYLLQEQVRIEIGKYDLDESDLKKFSPLFYKKDPAGRPMPGATPMLYPKAMISKKDGNIKITSIFATEDGEELDPLTLIGKQCDVRAAIRFESIFVGNKISLQMKLHEASVTLRETGMKRLITQVRQKPVERVIVCTDPTVNALRQADEEEAMVVDAKPVVAASSGSLPNSDDEAEDKPEPPKAEEEAKAPAKKVPVRRIVKKN